MASKLAPWSVPPIVSPVAHVAVIGGGLAGCATAYALCQKGIAVSLYEARADLAQLASGNPAGLLMPYLTAQSMPMSDYYTAGFDYTCQVVKHLRAQGMSIFGAQDGLLYLSCNESLNARHQRLARAHPGRVEWVDQTRASQLAGIPLAAGGLWLKEAGWLVPPLLCQALKTACGTLLSVYYEQDIEAIESHAAGWQLMSASQRHTAEAVVVASAEQALKFTQCTRLPIMRAPGQLTQLQVSPIGKALKIPVCADTYVLPAVGDTQVIGASFRAATEGCELRDAEHEANFAGLDAISPELGQAARVQAYSGRVAVRAVTADHLPVVGPVAEYSAFNQAYLRLAQGEVRQVAPEARYWPNFYVSLAHGARGLSSCLLAGEIVASLIQGQAAPVNARVWQAIHPSRFWFRALQRHT